eukprot:g5597.t1
MVKRNFSLSGAGWLSPFHIGVLAGLRNAGLFNPATSKVAGASGGALVAAAALCNISDEQQLEVTKKLAHHCRTQGTWLRLLQPLQDAIEETLPHDCVEKVSNRLTVAVTRLSPKFQSTPALISTFRSRNELSSALIASCYIPFYVDVKPYYSGYSNWKTVDGGLVTLIPHVDKYIKVCSFPRHPLIVGRALAFSEDRYKNSNDAIAISCEDVKDFPFTLPQLIQRTFFPHDDIDKLYKLGKDAAFQYAEKIEKNK